MITINNEIKGLDKLEKLDELLTGENKQLMTSRDLRVLRTSRTKGWHGPQGPQGEKGPPGPAEVSPDLSALLDAINNSNKDLSNLKNRIDDLEQRGEIAPAPVPPTPIPEAPPLPLPRASSAQTAPSESENTRI